MIMDLAAAYQILGLPQGTPLKTVMVRYRHLVKIFHPDRFSNAEEKTFAEGELKKINNAREVVESYWQTVGVQPEEVNEKPATKEGAPRKASPTKQSPTKQNQNPGTGNGAKKPDPSPSPSPAKPSVWQALVIAWNTEIEPTLKKWDKRMSVEDYLDDYDNPIRVTHDTRRRRFWLGIALILLADILWNWQSGSRENSQVLPGPNDGSQSTTVSQPALSEPEQRQNQLDEHLKLVKSEHDRYFLRLQLDRCKLAIRQDILIGDQIELELKTLDLAAADRRRLEEMKLFHDRDRTVQEDQKNAIMSQLLQFSST